MTRLKLASEPRILLVPIPVVPIALLSGTFLVLSGQDFGKYKFLQLTVHRCSAKAGSCIRTDTEPNRIGVVNRFLMGSTPLSI
jgi:hypothetical protein